MTLNEVADADAEAGRVAEVRRGPVEHEADDEQRPAKAAVGETRGKQEDGGNHVRGTENPQRLDGGLLRGPHEDPGVHERDDHVAHPEGDAAGAERRRMASAMRRNPLIPTSNSKRTPSSRGGTALVNQA